MKTAEELLREIAEFKDWFDWTDEQAYYCKFCGESIWSASHQKRKKNIWHRKDCLWLQARQFFHLEVVAPFKDTKANKEMQLTGKGAPEIGC